MWKKLRLTVRAVVHSFWWLPLTLSLFIILLFAATYALDQSEIINQLIPYDGPPFSISVQGARQIAATIAGSLVTVASLVFSMTLVTLTVAAGNMGARLLIRYMRNRSIQITLSVFLAGFIYALLTLSTIGDDYVPRISILIVILMAILCLLWLAFAFNDLAKAIQVDQAIAHLSDSLCQSITGINEKPSGLQPVEINHRDFNEAKTTISATAGGYVESINGEILLEAAEESNVIIFLKVKPGTFVLTGEVLAEIIDQNPENTKATQPRQWESLIKKTVILASCRSDLDDPFFCLRLLNEIAVRALSPGINDIYTAIACVDHVALGVAFCLRQGLPPAGWANREGVLRLVYAEYRLDQFIRLGFYPIIQASHGMPDLFIRIISRLARLARLTDDPYQKKIIVSVIDYAYDQGIKSVSNDTDRSSVKNAYIKAKPRRCY